MKSLRRLIALALCLLFALPAYAAELKTSGRYTYYEENGGAVIAEYLGSATELTVPDTLGNLQVRGIGAFAFWQNKKLSTVTLPASLTSIAPGAFGYCPKLRTIKPQNDRFRFEDGALYDKKENTLLCVLYAPQKESFTVPDNVKHIGAYAFANHTQLLSVKLPKGLLSIGDHAFMWCEQLTEVALPDSVTTLGEHAFYFCRALKSITIPSGVTEIPACAFLSCDQLSEVTLPDGLTAIGEAAFAYCVNLASINLSHDTVLGENAFRGCALLVTD